MEEAIMKFDVEAGILNRRHVKGEIVRACFKENLQCEFVESKGLFASTYSFKITGDENKLLQLKARLEQWIRNHRDE